VMKWLRPDVSHANDVVRYMTDSGVAVKWVLQHLRITNVTYNGYIEMFCDNCNVYFTGVLDRRRSIPKYVSQHSCGRHVGCGVTCNDPKPLCLEHHGFGCLLKVCWLWYFVKHFVDIHVYTCLLARWPIDFDLRV
jgi:hypothetical protein